MKKHRHKFPMLLLLGGLSLVLFTAPVFAQSVLFDFDNAPLHSSLPIDLSVGGINAHFSANPAYYNYSVQRADVLGFTPVGFAGYCIYPNTIYPCDLLISFNPALVAASIMYAPEEYATDSSCTMRITAYMGTTMVGTNTYSIPEPGTWPTGTLSFSSTQPFDNIVIHYAAPPPTGGDYGPIFMADNLIVTAVALPTPTPTPTPTLASISGTILNCSNPVPGPVPNVVVDLTGDMTVTAVTDASGSYQFLSLVTGWSYTVTPSKSALTPGAPGSNINTVDVIATQRHFLNIAPLPPGCPVTAANVNGDTSVNTIDVVAIQRFFLGLSTGIANTGVYQFNPANRIYLGMASDQTGQDYDTLVFGDVVSPFAERSDDPTQLEPTNTIIAQRASAPEAALSFGNIAVDAFVTNSIVPIIATTIDAKNQLVGFQGDLTFDERVVRFEKEPVQKAGLTSGDWNVFGNVLPGRGPVRTLRISGYSNDFTPLLGSGILFELRMSRVSKSAQSTQLIWAPPPDEFIFIDVDLNTQKPAYAGSGCITFSGKRK